MSQPPPGFMLKTYFEFFNVESIFVFTSTFVDICSTTSYPFVFPSRSTCPPLDILKFIFTILRNQDNKVAFIRVEKDVTLAISFEFMKTCHNMNTILQTTGVYTLSLNGKIRSPNKTLSNIIGDLLLKSSHKK